MARTLLTVALGTLLLAAASCSGGSEPDSARAAMSFLASTAPAGRAPVSAEEFATPGSAFAVWATMTPEAYGEEPIEVFGATSVTLTEEGVWAYDEKRYWYPSMTYAFRAVWPATVAAGCTFTHEAAGEAILTVNDFDSTSGTDLMAASAGRNTPGERGDAPEEPVSLQFGHLLARVSLRGASDEHALGAERRVILERVALYGLAATGTWSSADGGVWTPGETAGTQEEPLFVKEWAEGITLEPAGADGTGGTDLLAGDEALLLVPQTIPGACRLEISFHYNVNSAHTFTYSAPLAADGLVQAWEAGKSYRYPFTVNTGIFFSAPAVEKWTDMPVNSPDFDIQ